jgi:hypothetical protein
VADTLTAYGAAPFIPHLFHFWELMSPRPYEDWLELDFDMLERCDALVRIEGYSPGADREWEYALEELRIPAFMVRFDTSKEDGAYLELPADYFEFVEDWKKSPPEPGVWIA